MQSMSFFDVEAAIKHHNEVHKTKYALNETFGFKYFNRQRLASIRGTLEYIYSGVDAEFFTNDERVYIKRRKEHYQAIKAYCENKVGNKISIRLNTPELATLLKQKTYYLTWMGQQQRALMEESHWRSWITDVPEIQMIKEHWMRQAMFAHHTHTALLLVSEVIISLIEHHEQALKALKRYPQRLRIPNGLYVAYHDYLVQFLKEARRAQHCLAEAMLARLKLYEHKQTNVISALYTELEKKGVRITHRYQPLPEYRDELKPTQLCAYHHYITQHGHSNTQRRLKTLSWFHSSPIWPTVTRLTPTGVQLIPEKLANGVPKKIKFPTWFFKGEQLRNEFFQDKLELMIVLKQSPKIEAVQINKASPKQWQTLLSDIHRQEDAVNHALKELTDKKYQSLFSLFHYETRRFLTTWRHLLLEHRQQQLENKVCLAEKFSETLTGHPVLHKAVFAWSQCQFLQTLITEIQHDIQRKSVSEDLKIRVNTLTQRHTELLTLNRIINVFQTLADGSSVTESEFYYFTSYMDWLKLRDERQYQALLECCLPQRMAIVQQFSKGLKQFFSSPSYTQQREHCLCLYLMIKQFGTDNDKVKHEHIIKKFFLRFLEAVLMTLETHKDIKHQQQLTIAETLLNAIGKDVMIAGMTLSEHLLEIQSVQHNPVSLKCKCLALATQLAEERLKQRYEKDKQHFDATLQHLLLSQPGLGYAPTHLRILIQIRDRAIQEQTPLDTLTLKKSERILAGLEGDETKLIKPLLEASIQTHQVAQQIHDAEISLKQKTQCLAYLTTRLHSTLQGFPSTLLHSHSGRRLLFTKSYLHPALLPDEANPPRRLEFLHNSP